MIASLMALSVTFLPREDYQWKTVPVGGGGAIVSTLVHPQKPVTYLMGDVSGLWRWSEKKQSWKYLSSFDQWDFRDPGVTHWSQGVALDPSDQSGRFVCSIQGHPHEGKWWGRFLYSYDQGDTWFVERNTPFETRSMPGRLHHALAVDPKNQKVVYFAANNGLWQTVNLGKSWKRLNGPHPGASLIVPDPQSERLESPRRSRRLYAAFNEIWVSGSGRWDKDRTLYVSNDGGESWQLLSGAPLGVRRLFVLANGDLLTGGQAGIHRFSAGHWTDLTPRKGADWVVDYDVKRPHRLAAVDACYPNEENRYRRGEFFASDDGGRSWQSLNGREDFIFEAPWMNLHGAKMASWALGVDPHQPGRVWFGDYYSPFAALNFWSRQKSQWNQKVKGFEEMVLAGTALTALQKGPVHLLFGAADNGGFALESLSRFPEANLWQRGLSGRNIAFTGFDYAGLEQATLAGLGVEAWGGGGEGYVAVSRDSGKTGRYLPSVTDSSGSIALSANGRSIACGGNHGVSVSWDSGDTWKKTLDGWSGSDEIFQGHNKILASDKVEPETFYRYQWDGSCLSVSKDGGRSWEVRKAPEKMSELRVHPWRAGEVWLAGENGLAVTRNQGKSFRLITNVRKVRALAVGLGSSPKTISIYIAAEMGGAGGYFRSDDDGAHWTRIDAKSAPTQQPFLEGDLRKWKRCFVATAGTGLWVGEPS